MANDKKKEEKPNVKIKSEVINTPNEMVIREIMVQKGIDREAAIAVLTESK